MLFSSLSLNKLIAVVFGLLIGASSVLTAEDVEKKAEPISFAKSVRPILAKHCFGCHQGARSEGDYNMVGFESLLEGGISGDAAVVPGKPDESYLIDVIKVHDGKAEMPPTGEPISEANFKIIQQWVSEGAKNDYRNDSVEYSTKNPPPYTRQPNITSLDYSPDGKWLAVTGYHEVILLDANSLDQSKIVKRLIGLSSRVESVKFSPDGKRLAVSGGNPAELGEVQIWDVETGKLKLSKVVSYDTVYGVNWSPNGKLVSFGSTDTNLRAIDAFTGEQVFFQGAHEDWIRDTVFSVDGSQLVSVGRDMSCKLNEVGTQRFVDNITSITPGVLKGGIASVVRHPERDEVIIGGADGIPKAYRMNRITKRVIGDDANLVRVFPKMAGRIQSIDISKDGKRMAAGSSLNGKGAVNIYTYEFDPSVSKELQQVLRKQPRTWNKKERELVEKSNQDGVKLLAETQFDQSGVYAIAFHPKGKTIAAAGADGIIRFVETESGKILHELEPVTIAQTESATSNVADWHYTAAEKNIEPLPQTVVTALKVSPEQIQFHSPTDYSQLVVEAILEDGSTLDVTHHVNTTFDEKVVRVDQGFVQVVGAGQTDLKIGYENASYSIPVDVNLDTTFQPNFIRDVNPILTKLGCNQGTCHGSAGGKMGFKLSLRGYDPIFDVRAFTDDMGSRRANLASPNDSLMLKKPSSAVAHQGGHLIDPDSRYYRIVRDWIKNGAKLDLETPKVASVEVFPKNPVLIDADWKTQMRVVATYSDGTQKDVTRESFLEIGNIEIAKVDGSVVTALRRGETPVLARYEGAFTATTLTVMGDRTGFAWEQPETWGTIDENVADKWKRMKIVPSQLCTDEEFIRRIYLDLTGLPPTAEQVVAFAADQTDTKTKRARLVDSLIGNDSFVEHWSNKWADLLQVNRKYLGAEGAVAFRNWIRQQVKSNRPYNEFAYDILTASGSNKDNPAASYFKIHRTPQDTMENTTHLFLATRFNCNKCHDHPFERWTQDQYYETAAFFAQVDLKLDPQSGKRKIGGSAVESAKPLYEIISDKKSGEITHDRTGQVTAPAFPFDCDFESKGDASRREQLASWITSSDNPYFATSYVNRLWGYLLGVGLIEPLDDIRAGNPPSNPQLLEFLRDEFIESGFDTRHIIQLICKSRTYQLAITTNPFNADDNLNYSHGMARRLPAEVLFDSIHFVTGSALKIPGVKPGTRAAALPDSGAKLPSGFLSTLGRPNRESACECERASDLQLGSVLALVSGPDVSKAINDPENRLKQLIEKEADDAKVINQLFLQVLNRPATDQEVKVTLDSFNTLQSDHQGLVSALADRKTVVDKERPGLEKQRAKAIAKVSKQLNDAIKAKDPELLKKEADRLKRIEAAQKALADYKSQNSGLESWTLTQREALQWHPALIKDFNSKAGREFQLNPDRSVLVKTNKAAKDVYTFTTYTDLNSVSAIRLELLTDKSFQAKGPGLGVHGNIVLTEFEVEVAHPDRPNQWKKVDIESALANHEQPNYPIRNALDGNRTNRSGWALGGNVGKENWGTFQLKSPIGFSRGTLVRFHMHQQFDDSHQIGRFRISFTRHDQPVGLSLPESFLTELAKPKDKRNQDIQKQVVSSFEKSDRKLQSLKNAVANQSKPLAIDKEIVDLRAKLARVSKPVPPDAKLVQLEKDVAMSEVQLGNQRLTAAQDLVWALINSPSFLFNR